MPWYHEDMPIEPEWFWDGDSGLDQEDDPRLDPDDMRDAEWDRMNR